MRVLLPFVLPLFLPFAATAQEAPRLTVSGTGEVSAVPDMASITVSVTREAEEAGAAMDALSEATDAVLERIAAEGIAPEDVQTGQLSLQPRWDRRETLEEPRITGYVARTALTLRVRDLDRLGTVLDAVVTDGANGMDSLQFSQSEPREGEDEARRAAYADAMAKARLYAEAAGLAVGPIVTLSEGRVAAPGPMMMAAEMDMARSMPVAPGEVTQSVTVTLEVELVAAE